MRLLYLNRGVVLTFAAIATSTACGGDFHVTGSHKGLSGTGGKTGAGATASDGGPSSGGTDADGAAAGGSGNGARGGTTGHGGANAGGNTSIGGNDAGGDGGAAAGGSGNGGSAGSGNGGTASGGASTGGRGGSGGTTATGGTAGVNHSQFVKDYNRKCAYDSECTLVFQGSDVCSCDAQCPNASIATSALDQWNKDRQALMCVPLPCAKLNCQSLVASCGSSLCYARKPVIIDASHYDQSCLSAADCTTIPTGEICSPCQCSKGAVSNKGYQDYLKDKQDVQCSPGPVACDCAPPPNQTLTCVLSISGSGIGKCTLTTGAVATN
jgi:hypothetical protein